MAMRIASVDACPDPGYLVLICTHIIINYLSINVIIPPGRVRLVVWTPGRVRLGVELLNCVVY